MAPKSSGSDGHRTEEDETDALGRKVWDKDHFIERAKNNIMFGPERIGRRKDPVIPLPASQRTFLKQRTQDLELDKNLGKSQVVTQHTIKPMQGGYWCSVCECLIKDSAAWLEHINGRRHNRNLGMNMKVEKIGVDRVREKLRAMRKTPDGESGASNPEDIAARIEAVEAIEEAKKQRKKEKKKRKKGKGGAPGGEEEDEDDDGDVTGDEEGEKPAKKAKKADGEEDDEDDDEEVEETEEMKMMKMMGIPTGFS